MLVIVSMSRLDNDRIEIGVARPQHDSNPAHNYSSEKEVRAVWDKRRANSFSPEIAGTDERRAVEIPSDGCSAKRFAV